VLYRYSRYHLEATIEFLKQYDEKNEMDVMSSKEITDTIEKIKLELSPDDKSHFSFDKKERTGEESEESDELTIEGLWKRWEDLNERGIGDKSDEGQELRDDIRAFIDDNDLRVRVVRGKSNQDLLEDIEDALEVAKSPADKEDEDEKEPTPAAEPEQTPEEEGDNNEPGCDDEEPSKARREHNDDTNEPAIGSRRSARPARRRR